MKIILKAQVGEGLLTLEDKVTERKPQESDTLGELAILEIFALVSIGNATILVDIGELARASIALQGNTDSLEM